MPSKLIVITGQSQARGLFPTSTETGMPINNFVESWQPINGSQSTGASEFVVCNPQRSFTYDDTLITLGTVGGYRTAGPEFGFPVGHMGWAAANFAQQQEQNTTFFVSIAKGNTGIAAWADGAEMEARLAVEVPLAIAAIETATGDILEGPDLVIWAGGENNSTLVPFLGPYMTPAAFASALTTFKTLTETKWSAFGHTKWAVCEFLPAWQTTYMVPGWNGIELFVAGQGSDVQLISSLGTTSPDDAHYYGDDTNEMGLRAAYERYRTLVL
jgi:hypothetical protein